MFNFKSIRTKLIVIFFLLIFLPMAALGITIYTITYQSFEDATASSADMIVSSAAREMQSQFDHMKNYLRALSTNDNLVDSILTGDPIAKENAYNLLLEEQQGNSELIEGLVTTGTNGIAVSDSGGRDSAIDLHDRQYVQDALAGKVSVSDVLTSKQSGENIITVAMPLKNNGTIVGTLCGVMKFEKLIESIKDITLGEEGYAYMVDNTGLIISHPVGEKVLSENLNETGGEELKEVVDYMAAGETGSGMYTYEGEEKFVSYTPVENFSLALTDPKSDFMATANKIGLIVVVLAIVAIVVAMGIAWVFSRRMVRNIHKLQSSAEQLAKGNTDEDIHIESKDEFMLLGESFKSVALNINQLISEIQILTQNIIEGNLNERGNPDEYEGGYRAIIEGINGVMDTIVSHIDSIPMPLALFDKEMNIKYVNRIGTSAVGKNFEELRGKNCGDILCTDVCHNEKCPGRKSLAEGIEASAEAKAGENEMQIYTVPFKDPAGNIKGLLEIITDQTDIKKAQRDAQRQAEVVESQMSVAKKQTEYQKEEVQKLIANLEKLANGNLDISTSIGDADEDTEEIAENFKKINSSLETSTKAIKSYIDELSDILGKVAEKNLSVEIDREYMGDFVALKDSINHIILQLNNILSEFNASAEQVETGSSQVASSSQNLSQGSSEQAGSVEEISASITQVAEQTKENAEKAAKANDLSEKAKKDAQDGNKQMEGMLAAMNDIKESSQSISNIIKVIDEIAFQTNILALNAAVEAARAGEHGKGFAVVAEEVRNLAARSAKAAKETTELIDNSNNKVEDGYRIANETAGALEQIVTGIANAVGIVGAIADASNEQANAINEINRGIEQISQVTQSNTATAEESASASEEMAGQAQMLKNMIQEFKLKGDGRTYSADTFSKSTRLKAPKEEEKKEINLDDDNFGKY